LWGAEKATKKEDARVRSGSRSAVDKKKGWPRRMRETIRIDKPADSTICARRPTIGEGTREPPLSAGKTSREKGSQPVREKKKALAKNTRMKEVNHARKNKAQLTRE